MLKKFYLQLRYPRNFTIKVLAVSSKFRKFAGPKVFGPIFGGQGFGVSL